MSHAAVTSKQRLLDGHILHVQFMGHDGIGSEGNPAGHSMQEAIDEGLKRHRPAAVLVDLRDLEYQHGDWLPAATLKAVGTLGRERACLLAEGSTLQALRSLWTRNQLDQLMPLFGDMDTALAHLLAPADELDEHPGAASTIDAARDEAERPQAIQQLLRTFTDERQPLEVRAAAAMALARLRHFDALESIVQWREQLRPLDPRELTEALDELGTHTPADALTRWLEDEDAAVRAWAAATLGRRPDIPRLERLIERLDDAEPCVQKAAAMALTRCGGAAAERALIELTKRREDNRGQVRQWAAWALGKLGRPEAVEPLVAQVAEDERMAGLVARGPDEPTAIEMLLALGRGWSDPAAFWSHVVDAANRTGVEFDTIEQLAERHGERIRPRRR